MKNPPSNIPDPESDEISPTAMAQREAGLISLKCRTLEEAFLICEELEMADIIAMLPDERKLKTEFKQRGYVEVKVSAAAYEALVDLRSSVEFQYKQMRAEKRLSIHGMIFSVGCGLIILPGSLVFTWLLFNNRKNGYRRRAREITFCFAVGAVIFLITTLYIALTLHGSS